MFTLVLFPLVFSGCGSVSVTRIEKTPGVIHAPQTVYVKNFSYAPGSLSEKRVSDRDFQWIVGERLGRALAQRIRARIAPARIIAANAPLAKQNAWLVTGQFMQVDEGCRLSRTLFGWACGATKMRTITEVYNLRNSKTARKPFLLIETTGGSNAMPGLVFGNPAELRSGLTVDAQRTAREITQVLQSATEGN